MATRFSQKACGTCEQRTRHKIEYNNETGWRRETCMPCWNQAMERSKAEGADA